MDTEYFPQGIPLDALCVAALSRFTRNGYHGTSIREIATESGLSVAGLYHHYPSKAAILETMCEVAMQELLAGLQQAKEASRDPLDRFNRIISCLLQFHAEFGDIAFVTYSEIRSLEPVPRERHLQSRREVQSFVTEAVEEGNAAGVFTTSYPRHAARAITNICLGVAQWYRPEKTMGIPELVSVYSEICRDTVRHTAR